MQKVFGFEKIIPAFIPDPDKALASTTNGTITLGKATNGYTVDITGWEAVSVRPSSDSYYYYNSDTTKTRTLPADQAINNKEYV